MAKGEEVKINKTLLIGIILSLIVIVSIVGFKIYDDGQRNMLNKVKQEQAIKELEEQHKERIIELKNIIPQKQAKIQIAYNELKEIKSFQLLRSSEEKEQQLAAQNKKINAMSDEINKLQQELSGLENR